LLDSATSTTKLRFKARFGELYAAIAINISEEGMSLILIGLPTGCTSPSSSFKRRMGPIRNKNGKEEHSDA
jgi:hypothetical protein